MSAGAYTASYSTVWFNGFEPLRTFYVSAAAPVTRMPSTRSQPGTPLRRRTGRTLKLRNASRAA